MECGCSWPFSFSPTGALDTWSLPSPAFYFTPHLPCGFRLTARTARLRGPRGSVPPPPTPTVQAVVTASSFHSQAGQPPMFLPTPISPVNSVSWIQLATQQPSSFSRVQNMNSRFLSKPKWCWGLPCFSKWQCPTLSLPGRNTQTHL